jgi:monofunctional glycosyltransferase
MIVLCLRWIPPPTSAFMMIRHFDRLTTSQEVLWTKGKILEVYLNIAEFGNGIYGVHAASAHFFAKTADQLTRREAALLAAVLPSPRRLHADRPSPYLQSRARWIQTNMNRLGGTRVVDRIWAQPGHG